MNKPKFIAASCHFTICPDNWKEGEGKCLKSWTEDVEGSDTVEGVLKNVPYLDYNHGGKDLPILRTHAKPNGIFQCDPINEEDYSRFDADLAVDMDEDGDILSISDSKMERFMKNEVNIYSLHVTVQIKKIVDLSLADVCFSR